MVSALFVAHAETATAMVREQRVLSVTAIMATSS